VPSTIQPSFSAGEVTPSAYGRVDLARYQSGLKTLRNFFTRVHGGAINRPGTEFIAKALDQNNPGRLIPFVASDADSYVLDFTDLAMTVIRDAGLVLETPKTITATTNTSQVIVTSAGHGFAEGDRIFVSGTGLAALDGRVWYINAVNANTFQLVGSMAPGGAAAVGTVARIYRLVTPFTESQLMAMGYTQLNDVMTLAHQSVKTRDLSRFGHTNWTVTDMAHEDGPFQDLNVTATKGVVASAVSGAITLNSTHSIFSSANIGQLFYLEQKDYGLPWEVGKAVSAAAIRRSEGKYYEALGAGTTGTLRPSHEQDSASDGVVTWLYKHNGWGVALITAVADGFTATATVESEIPIDLIKTDKAITAAADNGSGLVRLTSNAHGYVNNDFIMVYGVVGTTEANGLWRISGVTANTFDLVGSAFVNAYVSGGNATENGSYKWAFGAWGGDRGWAGLVTYFQQRKTLAATAREPLKTWHSGTNSFDFFGKSSPIVDSDGFSMTLAAKGADPLVHLVNLGKLVALTSSVASLVRPSSVGGGKWVIPDDDNNPILSPSKRSARAQDGDSVLYVGANSHAVKDLAYEFASNSYGGKDLSVLSKHLLEGHQIVDAAYQHVPWQIYWMVRDDGVLIGMTYLREHEIWGWHRHDTTHGFFERVCVVPEGGEDRVYFKVRRTIDGQTVRYIERLASRLYTDIKDAHFVDSALVYDGRNVTAITMTLSGGSGLGYGQGDFGELEYGYEVGDWPYAQDLTLTASAAYFETDDVGTEIHFTLDDGRILRLLILTYLNFSQVTVRANRNVPAAFQNVALTAWGHAKCHFVGLGHLEGETVSILADGHVHPQLTVASEAVDLQYCATVVRIGLPIEADLETLNLNIANAGSILDKEKLVFAVRMMVEESRGIFAGSDAAHLQELGQRNAENYDDPVTPLTGLASIRVPSRWEPGGRVFIRQSDPLPLSVLAVMPDLEIGGSK
jgi:hypothetical protein